MYLKDYPGGSWDICFCNSDCKESTCRRCKRSETYQKMMEYGKKNPWYCFAVSDFSKKCSKYKGEKK